MSRRLLSLAETRFVRGRQLPPVFRSLPDCLHSAVLLSSVYRNSHSKHHDRQPRRTLTTTAAQRKQHRPMALYPPSPAPPVAGDSPAKKNEKLIFAPSPDSPLATATAQAAIARRASVGGGDASGSGVSSGNDDNDNRHATHAHRPRPPRAGQFQRHEHAGGLRRADLDPHGPITQFHAWFAEAKGLRDARDGRPAVPHPETCTLSTASLPSGRVSARVVYLKELDHQGFVLYSNFGTSRKAADLFNADHPNPWAALTFWWEPLERQVRVEGRAARLPAAESQVYFDTRVRGSRIGAWASRQSAVLQPATGASGTDEKTDTTDADADDGRAQLDKWVAEVEARFGPSKAADGGGDDDGEVDGDHIPVPPFWGGLRIVPERVEFWQGRHNRLHDRFVYTRVHKVGSDESEDNAKIADATWTLERLSP